ncbi:MAG: riboflavin biosynthesis protein RibF [Paludibacteraceae bacterium]|nr:riboflavin biosynthesis protein RibF [Paludibacteraceae bacterium]
MGRIATIGFFDGVHRGHCFLFEHLHIEAQTRKLSPLIVTFDRHPRSVLQADYIPRLLTTLDERTELLKPFGEVVVFPFEEICRLTAVEFMQRLRDDYQVQTILMGYDHRFGADRLRHPVDYRRAGETLGLEIITQGEYIDGEWHVSSTEIRQALENGNIAVANELLGRPYQISGTVVHGNGIGRTIGFPTANIRTSDAQKIIPRPGVYGVEINSEALIGRNGCKGILNIGTNPTVGNKETTIELHIPNYEGDLYGTSLSVRFLEFIREEKRFDNLIQLKKQIAEDISNL